MDDSLRKLQLAELDLLKEFDLVCKEHGILYFAMGGTLLGAIRHQGFIPWDDDIDIGIPRPEYDRLEVILSDEKYRYLQYRSFHVDSGYNRYFARIESPKVKVIRRDKSVPETSNAWIDIFPLDAMPNNKILRCLHKYRVLMLRAEYRISDYEHLVDTTKKNRPLAERIVLAAGKHKIFRKIFRTRKCLFKLEKTLKKYDYHHTDYLVNAMGAWSFKEMFRKEHYGNGTLYCFEDMKILGPDNYDFVLKQMYGDYMTPPQKNEDMNHHKLEVVIDFAEKI